MPARSRAGMSGVVVYYCADRRFLSVRLGAAVSVDGLSVRLGAAVSVDGLSVRLGAAVSVDADGMR